MGFNVGGMAAAYSGYNQGRDDELARQRLQTDQKYQDSQRAYQATQQARTIEEQKRADTLRADLAAIPSETTTNLNAGKPALDNEGTPAASGMPVNKTTQIPEDVQLRQAASAYRKQGDFTKALEEHSKADLIGITRSAQKFQELNAASTGMSALQLAQAAAQIFNDDPVPGGISNVRDDGNGGVIMTVENKMTGQTTDKQFANAQALREHLMAYKAPAVYAQLQQLRNASAIKQAEEAAKPQKLSPGQILVQDGRTIASAPPPAGYEYVGPDANGDPMYRKMAPGAGAGAGAGGKAGKGGDPIAEARTILKDIAEKSEDKLTTDQRTWAEDNIARLVTQNPNLPPAMAARVAVTVAKDPTKLQPAIDPDTGKVNLIFKDGVNGNIAFNRDVATAVNFADKGISKEAMLSMTKAWLDTEKPMEKAAKRRAAFSPEARRDLEQSLRQQAERAINEKIANATPEQATQLRQAIQAKLDQALNMLSGQLDLIYNHDPEARKLAGNPPPRTIGRTGGLGAAAKYTPPPDSPAGRAKALRDQAAAKAGEKDVAQRAESATLSSQFQRDSKSLPPLDLVRKYDDIRSQLTAQDAAALQAIEKTIR